MVTIDAEYVRNVLVPWKNYISGNNSSQLFIKKFCDTFNKVKGISIWILLIGAILFHSTAYRSCSLGFILACKVYALYETISSFLTNAWLHRHNR